MLCCVECHYDHYLKVKLQFPVLFTTAIEDIHRVVHPLATELWGVIGDENRRIYFTAPDCLESNSSWLKAWGLTAPHRVFR